MTEVTQLLVINISMPCLFLLLSIMFTIHGIVSTYLHCHNHKQNEITITAFSISAMVLFTLCMIICVTIACRPFTDNPDHHILTSYTAYIIFNCGRITMYLLFLSIVHYSFRKTSYDYSKYIKFIYLIFAISIPLTAMTLDSIETLTDYCSNEFDECDIKYIKRFIEHSGNIILSIFATSLFVRSLYKITSNINEQQNEENKIWIDTFTKYTILVLFIVVFGLIVVTMVVLTQLGYYQSIFGFEPEKWSSIVWIIYYMDCFINVLCIYLRFDFASSVYNKMCRYFHYCCQKVINRCIDCKREHRKSTIPSLSSENGDEDRSMAAEKQSYIKPEDTQNQYNLSSTKKTKDLYPYGLSLGTMAHHTSNSNTNTRLMYESTKTSDITSTNTTRHIHKTSKEHMKDLANEVQNLSK